MLLYLLPQYFRPDGVQAEALQQTRKEVQQLEEHLQGQQHSVDQLAAERDACKSGAHEAADRYKVTGDTKTGDTFRL